MRIDLHTHSNKSDGTQTPTELIASAIAVGLDVVAITDHDSVAGWDEATIAADNKIQLVRGVELSTHYRGVSVHLLGYEFDPTNTALAQEFDRLIHGRDDRVPAMIERLNDLGIDITEADVARQSTNAVASGRPHIADALVEKGFVVDRQEAFDRYLAESKPAYVDRYSTDLLKAIELITQAGGKTVIAHPWSRSSVAVLTHDVFAQLVEVGLNGIEADHNDHDAKQREELKKIARELHVVYTGSSDYHGTGKIDFDLGCNMTEPDQFERLFV